MRNCWLCECVRVSLSACDNERYVDNIWWNKSVWAQCQSPPFWVQHCFASEIIFFLWVEQTRLDYNEQSHRVAFTEFVVTSLRRVCELNWNPFWKRIKWNGRQESTVLAGGGGGLLKQTIKSKQRNRRSKKKIERERTEGKREMERESEGIRKIISTFWWEEKTFEVK